MPEIYPIVEHDQDYNEHHDDHDSAVVEAFDPCEGNDRLLLEQFLDQVFFALYLILMCADIFP